MKMRHLITMGGTPLSNSLLNNLENLHFTEQWIHLHIPLPEDMECDGDPVQGGGVAAVVSTLTQIDGGQGEGGHGLGHVVGEAALRDV